MDRAELLSRLRARLSRLWRASAGPAYAFILLKILDTLQRVELVGRMMGGGDVLAFVRDWGWAFGLAWLGYLLLRPERREDDVRERDKAFAELPGKVVTVLQRFDAFCRAYEKGGATSAARARLGLDFALVETMRVAVKTTPAKERYRYENAMVKAMLDSLLAIDRGELSAVSRQVDLLEPIRSLAGRKPRPKQSADPPSTTAPEQPRPSSPESS